MPYPLKTFFVQIRRTRLTTIKSPYYRFNLVKINMATAARAVMVGLILLVAPVPTFADENLRQFGPEHLRQFANQHLRQFADLIRRRFAHRKKPVPVPTLDCTLIVPREPLTATGLATPYQLVATNRAGGPCHEANEDQSAFVQAAIIDLDNGQISVYNPVVVDKGTEPAAPPVVPVLPTHHVVALWFGFNGNNLKLVMADPHGDNLSSSRCVQGLGQFAYCNAVEFFNQAHQLINDNRLSVPALGKDKNGNACPSVRSFSVVDADQSDNLTTVYLFTSEGEVAQDTATNRAMLSDSLARGNPSDNRLLNAFIQPALGCTPWTVPDLTNPGSMVPALPLNELQANMYQAPPIALIPLGDPFALNPPITGTPDLRRVNLYRRGVDQPRAQDPDDASTRTYCRNLRAVQPKELFQNKLELTAFRSPDSDAANNLFTFMAQRYVATYEILKCEEVLKKPVNVELKADESGVVVDATRLKKPGNEELPENNE